MRMVFFLHELTFHARSDCIGINAFTKRHIMNIDKLIQEKRCILLSSKTKNEALYELLDMADSEGCIKDMENLRKEIFYREQIMSTGIGQGIAIPHIRFKGVKEPYIYVGVQPQGIEDYESLDNQPVKIILMIIVGEDQHKEYLRVLSLVVSRLKSEALVQELVNAGNPETIVTLFTRDDDA